MTRADINISRFTSWVNGEACFLPEVLLGLKYCNTFGDDLLRGTFKRLDAYREASLLNYAHYTYHILTRLEALLDAGKIAAIEDELKRVAERSASVDWFAEYDRIQYHVLCDYAFCDSPSECIVSAVERLLSKAQNTKGDEAT